MRHKSENDIYWDNVAQWKSAKAALECAAMEAEETYRHDKPAIRQAINDYADMLIGDLPNSISDDDKAEFESALSDLACALHPKD